ncbi:MAG: site-2 protease family protein [Actinomycetes bacterium]
MNILGVLAFVVALLFSVMVHEFGHYLTARKFQMKVSEFFLGFGKRLWSFQRGETEFGIKAIPAGGYCRIEGMTPSDPMPVGESGRAFYRASSGKKLLVLGAGSFLHFVLGFLILLIILIGIGTTQVTSGINQVSPCVPKVGAACVAGDPISPAKSAGLISGDRILSVNGQSASNWAKAVQVIRDSAGREVLLSVDRAGSTIDVRLTPATRIIDGKPVGFIGIVNRFESVRSNPWEGFTRALSISGQYMKASVTSLWQLPAKLPQLWSQTVGGKPRDPQSLVGVVGVARASGQTVASSQLSTPERIGTFLLIIASLNFFIGIFNLLPLLPLDGGHIAVVVVDEIRAFIARLRGRSRPAPIDVAVLTPLTVVVLIALVGLTLVLLFADIFNPVKFNL